MKIVFKHWWNEHKRSIQAAGIFFSLFFGKRKGWLKNQSKTKTGFVFLKNYSTSIHKVYLPEIQLTVQDGMGEHYGFPRHSLYLVIYWNHQGYYTGVEFRALDKD
jgi:hypothetical protein